MKKNLFTLTLIVFGLSLPTWAEEPEDTEVEKEGVQITIVAKGDLRIGTVVGDNFFVDPVVIESQSTFVKNILEDVDDLTVPITISAIDGPAFKQMYDLMKLVHSGNEGEARNAVKRMVKNDDDFYRVAKVADYLGADKVIRQLARAGAHLVHSETISVKIVIEIGGHGPLVLVDESADPAVKKNWVSRGLIDQFAEQVAKYHSLEYGEEATPQRLRDLSYGFSIRELLAYGRVPPIMLKGDLKTLDLNGMRINSLDGFDEIPEIETIQRLHLNNNQLSSLPENFLANNREFIWLNLDNNELRSLPENFLANNRELIWLNLDNNKLRSLPENFLANNRELIWLNLDNNKLRSLPANFLANNQALGWLSFINNQLSSLPAGFLANNQRLRVLNLENNQFSDDEKRRITQELEAAHQNIEIQF